MTNRRDFLKLAGLAGGAVLVPSVIKSCSYPESPASKAIKGLGRGLKLTYRPFELQMIHVFTVAGSSRTTTQVMLAEIEFEGVTGYGESSMPPYLGESSESVSRFLEKVDLSQFTNPFLIDDILAYVDAVEPGNPAAKTCIDIALHDLVGKLMQQPWFRIWGLNPDDTPDTSFTIGIDTPEIVKQKTLEAEPYNILKVKMGYDTDKAMIKAIREVTQKPVCVDVNQGWKDKHHALDMIYWLKEHGVVFVEQPMPIEAWDDMAWLTQHAPLPTIADESVQGVEDVKKTYQVFDGINIKLMKARGMRGAHQMATIAKGLNMKVMLGCMVESSCAISAAAQLSPVAQWCDLDGNLLISNDIFTGMKIVNGKVTLSDMPGIGAVPIS